MIVINVQLTLPPVSHSLHLLYMYMIYRQFKSKECCALIVVFLSLHSSLSLYIVDSGMCVYLCVCVHHLVKGNWTVYACHFCCQRERYSHRVSRDTASQ